MGWRGPRPTSATASCFHANCGTWVHNRELEKSESTCKCLSLHLGARNHKFKSQIKDAAATVRWNLISTRLQLLWSQRRADFFFLHPAASEQTKQCLISSGTWHFFCCQNCRYASFDLVNIHASTLGRSRQLSSAKVCIESECERVSEWVRERRERESPKLENFTQHNQCQLLPMWSEWGRDRQTERERERQRRKPQNLIRITEVILTWSAVYSLHSTKHSEQLQGSFPLGEFTQSTGRVLHTGNREM